jgi:hypothetical protein
MFQVVQKARPAGASDPRNGDIGSTGAKAPVETKNGFHSKENIIRRARRKDKLAGLFCTHVFNANHRCFNVTSHGLAASY